MNERKSVVFVTGDEIINFILLSFAKKKHYVINQTMTKEEYEDETVTN